MFLMRWFFRLLLLSLVACLVYIAWPPDVASLRNHNPKTAALIELRKNQARDAKVKLRTVWIWKDMRHISPDLIHAVLLAEDDRFYYHRGFDIEQIKEAARRNWAEKRYVYGGSTITQQLARTLYLSPRKNLLRKAREAVLTIYLEHFLSKKRILELYLNVVEWGRGVYGAEAAARTYFQTSAGELTADQSVALASILPSPRRWSPLAEKGFIARRRTRLYERMVRAGYVQAPVTIEISTGTLPAIDWPFETILPETVPDLDTLLPAPVSTPNPR